MREVTQNAGFNQLRSDTAEASGAKEAAGRVGCAGGGGSIVAHAGAQ
jgi:hypothetical protein